MLVPGARKVGEMTSKLCALICCASSQTSRLKPSRLFRPTAAPVEWLRPRKVISDSVAA